MKHLFPITLLFLLSAFASAAVAAGEAKTEAKAKGHWVCPSCGSPCDKEVFDHPGVCPTCGMKLVEQGTEAAPYHNEPLKKVAILIFNHVEIIDFAGPYEVFGAANFDVYTVGETKDPVVTAMGLTVVPRYRFADAPQPDILVVPGGGVQDAEKNGALLAWIKDKAAHGEHTMSVCNGAFILASAGQSSVSCGGETCPNAAVTHSTPSGSARCANLRPSITARLLRYRLESQEDRPSIGLLDRSDIAFAATRRARW